MNPRRLLVSSLGLGAAAVAALAILAVAGCQADGPAAAARRGAQAPAVTNPEIVAELKGEVITLADLEKGAGAELRNLEAQRQKLLQRQLDRTAAAKLLEIEAKERGLTVQRLVLQAQSRVPDPSPEEVDRAYEAGGGAAREPKAKAVPRIRQALLQQRQQQAYARYIEELKEKHGFRSYLQPFRQDVDAGASPALGPASAPVTIVSFSDFECPYCATLSRTLADVARAYPGRVRLVFKHLPLQRLHPNAVRAAEAAACAADQGRFWQLHDAFFQGGRLTEAVILERAAAAGVDTRALQDCLAAGKGSPQVQADTRAAEALGVTSTPTFYINGRPMVGAMDAEAIALVIDEELKAAAAAR